MKAATYYLLRKVLSQQARNRLKTYQHKLRFTVTPLLVKLHGSFDVNDLEKELRSKISNDFDVLMVHSSFDSFLPMYNGNVLELLDMLLQLCDKQRTLAMPAFFLGGDDYEKIKYYRKHPVFDARRCPSEMGLLTDVFRRKKGVYRSLHPSHSICAYGPLADKLTSTHHLSNTNFGEGTPFDVMAKCKTIILGLGTLYFRVLTQVHAADDLLGDRFPVEKTTDVVPMKIIDQNGHKFDYTYRFNQYKGMVQETILRSLLTKEELYEWTFHGVHMFRTEASRVTNALIEAAGRGITIYR
ncbi:MAG: AAC(3) family N-acetyltransferase [Acidiferrobacterales bacterium]